MWRHGSVPAEPRWPGRTAITYPLFLLALLFPILAGASESTLALVPAQSWVEVRVFKAGLFSTFAHDHLLQWKGLSGSIVVEADGQEAGEPVRYALRLQLPVAELLVDDPEARRAAGMKGVLSETQRREVSNNMLAADQLDGKTHPFIGTTGNLVEKKGLPTVARVNLRIRDIDNPFDTAVTLVRKDGGILATGGFSILQSDFGITPYNTGLGTIAVKDRVKIRFHLFARATGR